MLLGYYKNKAGRRRTKQGGVDRQRIKKIQGWRTVRRLIVTELGRGVHGATKLKPQLSDQLKQLII